MNKAVCFLTCDSNGVEMMGYYQGIFNNCEILSQNIIDGNLITGQLKLEELEIYFMDMEPKYFVGYKHSFSILLHVESEEIFMKYFDKLKFEGQVMMGPEPVFDIKLVTWVTDKYGITWQLVYK